MVSLKVFDEKGKDGGSIDAKDDVFAVPVKDTVVHSAMVWQLASKRQGTASSKTRAEVRGGGKKPWKQKGTGRARAGTIRSPLWRGGGVTFGPKPRDYSFNLPKKVRGLAVRMAISDKVSSGKAMIVEKISLKAPKTKEMQAVMNNLGAKNALVVLDDAGINERKACANLENIKLVTSANVNLLDILGHEVLVMDKKAVGNIEGRLSVEK